MCVCFLHINNIYYYIYNIYYIYNSNFFVGTNWSMGYSKNILNLLSVMSVFAGVIGELAYSALVVMAS